MPYTINNAILGNIQSSDLIALTDDDGTGNINQPVLDTIIQNAGDVIDGCIGNIYDTPVSPAVAPIPSWSLTITCYMLYRRRLVPDEKNNFTEQYNLVMSLLAKVNNGEYRLALPLVRDFAQVAFSGRQTIYGGGSNFVTNSM